MFATVCAGGPTALADSESVDFDGIHGSTRFLPLARLRSRALVHSTAVEMSTRAEPGNMAPLASDLGELLAPTLAL